jgi:hypothetical protein
MEANVFRACVACLMVLVGSVAVGEIVSLEGAIKSVNSESREVTIAGRTLEITKKCRITLDGENATLDELRTDQQASIDYDSELEIATSIRAVKAKKVTEGGPDTDADLTSDEKALVGNWKAKSGKEGKSFDANRVVREWDEDGKEFNRGVWLVRKDGTFFAAFRNKYAIEGKLVSPNIIEFTVHDPKGKVVETLRMSR